ncbi:MAG TPA: alpha-glucosidase C-terminal domain-containing protein, partial [Rhizomicrobium sp.]|nr:alpha-glucosidase C-terminal domain-containing protein [Rhizomicrobium sp.]
PVSPLHQPLAVDIQQADDHSMLALTRKFIAARRDNPVLRLGEITFIDAPSPVLAFTRSYGDEKAICVFNMSGQEARFGGEHGEAVDLGCGDAQSSGGELRLGPYAAWFGRV